MKRLPAQPQPGLKFLIIAAFIVVLSLLAVTSLNRLDLLRGVGGQSANPAGAPEVAEPETPAGCPAATTELQPLSNPQHGYCLMYPAEYKVEKPGANQTILVIGGLLNSGDPRVHITVEPAAGRTAAAVAEEIAAGYPAEFGIERSSTTVAGEAAEVLDRLPGQDINRRVIFVHDGLLYDLYFAPVLDNDNQPFARFDSFYNQILSSFTFIPQTDTVTDECLAATADERLVRQEEHGYCLLLPGRFSQEQPAKSETVFYVDSLLNVDDPRLFISVEDAAGRTADEAAEALLAEFPPDFVIEQVGGMTLGYEPAAWLDNVPGQDLGRVLFIEHDGQLFRLTFVPAGTDAGEVFGEMEALFDLVARSFRFLPDAN